MAGTRFVGTALLLPLGLGLGALVALPGLLDSVPFDAAVLGEAGVLAGDDGALEVVGDLRVVHPVLAPEYVVLLHQQPPGLAALEARRLRVDDDHQRHPQQEEDLQRQRAEHQQRRATNQVPLHFRASLSRSACSTGAVCGRKPRQTKKAPQGTAATCCCRKCGVRRRDQSRKAFGRFYHEACKLQGKPGMV